MRISHTQERGKTWSGPTEDYGASSSAQAPPTFIVPCLSTQPFPEPLQLTSNECLPASHHFSSERPSLSSHWKTLRAKHRNGLSRAWWRIPLIPALVRLRQADLCEFSLVYIVSSSPSEATGGLCLKKKKGKKERARGGGSSYMFLPSLPQLASICGMWQPYPLDKAVPTQARSILHFPMTFHIKDVLCLTFTKGFKVGRVRALITLL